MCKPGTLEWVHDKKELKKEIHDFVGLFVIN
jgi:hypothetical protein